MRWYHGLLAAGALIVTGFARAATPPPGFADTVIFTATTPTAMAYEPGTGHLFVLEKGSSGTARVRRRHATSGVVTTALTLNCVDAAGERGLLGIAFDPGYAGGPVNRFVYLYYTRQVTSSGVCAGAATGSHNRVVRFAESNGTLSGEDLLLQGPTLTSATNHNGGTLRFAPDGTLFVSMGDNDTDGDANPRARDLGDLRGKLLRIRRDGTIPTDNPFVGQAGKRGEIWAWGLRNPFRFSIDPATGVPWIGDVGESTWEEIDRGVKGADYGYPCYEGPASFRTCNPAPAPGSVSPPAYAYGHAGQTSPVSGNSVTGGPVYRGGNFPASYDGRVFFGDYGAAWIRSAEVASNGTLFDVQMFVSAASAVVDIVQAPSGCLGWVSIGGGIHETCYTAGANRPPVPEATASPQAGPAPLDVQFTGSDSSDPDGDPLLYDWDLGDGNTSTAADPSWSYPAGVYTARLTVDDQQGVANSVASAPPLRIVSGNSSPAPSIVEPPQGERYDAGDTIDFFGSATDPEDGAIPSAGLSWTIVFHHDDHVHPFLGPVSGVASGAFTIPTAGEDATNVWYRIHLDATDSGAPLGPNARVTGGTFLDIHPNLSTITLAASPAGNGLKVTFNQTQVTAPASFDAVVHFPRVIAAPSTQSAGGRTWSFMHWNDAAANTRTIATPSSDTTYTAFFRCISSCAGLADMDGDGVSASGGDCDDTDFGVFPGAPEICDGRNNDCLGGADDATCADFGDGAIDGIDLALMSRFFGVCSPSAASQPWDEVDFTRDGCLDGNDLAVMGAVWGCAGTTPVCP